MATYEMRRQERKLSQEDAEEILKQGEYGILSTVSGDGTPYGVPLSYAYDGENIWFHGAKEGHKVDNLSQNVAVSFCVVGKTKVLPEKFSTIYESAIASGVVHPCEGEEKLAGLMALVKKYSPEFLEKGQAYAKGAMEKVQVYCMRVTGLSGKSRAK